MTNELSESSVLNHLRSDGLDGLAELFIYKRQGLRDMVARRINGPLSSRFDASDIVQEAYIRAQQQLPRYLESPTIPPAVWLRILCKQMLAELVRKHLRGKRTPALEAHNAGDQVLIERIADSLHSVGESIARRELLERVQNVLGSFSKAEQEIIDMRHSEAMSFPDIADALDLNMETVKKRYYRILEKFRTICASKP